MCTRAFQESDLRYSANGKQRPPAGTKCISGCIFEAGRWGASWCNTKDDNWGTGCVPCQPGKTFNTNEIACVLKIFELAMKFNYSSNDYNSFQRRDWSIHKMNSI